MKIITIKTPLTMAPVDEQFLKQQRMLLSKWQHHQVYTAATMLTQ